MSCRERSFVRWIAVLVIMLMLSAPFSISAIASPKRISIVYSIDSVPFYFSDENGQPTGLLIDLWRLWSEKTGVDVNFQAAEWNETLTMVNSGTADVHAGLFHNKEREKILDFGIAISETATHYFSHVSLPFIDKVEDLIPYRVGVIAGDNVEHYIKEKIPHCIVTSYSNYNALITDLNKGTLKVFAADTPTGLFYLKKYGIHNDFRFNPDKSLYTNDFFFAVQKNRQNLIDIINKGMELITEEEKKEINRRWIKTDEKNSETLVISMDRSYPPLNFQNDMGRPSGLLVDLWRMWAEKKGVKIQFLPCNWSESLDALRSNKADIHSGLSISKERNEWMGFSTPIYKTTSKIFYRAVDPQPAAIKDYKAFIVGTMFNSYQESKFRKLYSQINLHNFNTNQDLISALLKGKVKAVIQEELLMETDIDRLGLHGDIVSRPEKLFQSTVYAGVLKENNSLLKQINDGFVAMDPGKLARIESRWISDTEKCFFQKKGQIFSGIKLSMEELNWIAANPVIKVAATPNWPPFEFKDKDSYEGLHADIIRMAASKLGVKIDPVFDIWSVLVEKLKAGEVDLCPGLNATDDRKKYLLFTEPISETAQSIIIKEASKIGSIKDLDGKTVAVEKGYANEKYLKEKYPNINLLPQKETLNCLKLVISSDADAYIGTQAVALYLIKQRRLMDLKVGGFFEEARKSKYRIGVIKSKPVLRNLLQKGLDAISANEMASIHQKWFGVDTRQNTIDLTGEEKAWLRNHKKLELGIDPSWPPYEFIDENKKYSGISSGYVDTVAERLQINIQPVDGLTWLQVIEKAKSRQVDILSAVTPTEDRGEYLNFSKPYLSIPIIIAVNKKIKNVRGISDLQTLKVGVVKAYYPDEILTKNHPELKVIRFLSVNEGLKNLDEGKLDAFVDNLGAISNEINSSHFKNIEISAPTQYKFNLSFGVRKDWPELIGILNKALDDISDKEKLLIKNTWTAPVEIKIGIDLKKVLTWGVPIIAVIGLIIFVIIMWNRRLGREIAERKIAEAKYRDLVQNANSIIIKLDPEGHVTFFNEYAQSFFGYTPQEVLGKSIVDSIVPDEDAKGLDMKQFIMNIVRSPLTYEKNENENIRKNGERMWISWTNKAIFDEERQELLELLCIGTDITERKQFEMEIRESHKKITDSIKFASMIQNAMLSDENSLSNFCDDAFVHWKPKDVVGGDIFFIKQLNDENELLLFVIDCTGHGVPGALVTAIVKAVQLQAMVEVLTDEDEISPARLLGYFNVQLKTILRQQDKKASSNAGFDGGILYINKKQKIVKFSGANTPLFYIRDKKIETIKGDRHSVGYKTSDADYQFKDHTIEVNQETWFYMTTDGFLDQNGGDKGYPFAKKRLKQLLIDNYQSDFSTQKKIYTETIQTYRGMEETTDDVTFVGFKIK